jgi:site-specific DNA-methyltransferase (adenine-specific)
MSLLATENGIKPYYQDDAVTLYHGDCREILPTLGRFDLLLTDPPYGIGYAAGESSQQGIQKFERIKDDDKPFDASEFLGFKDAIIFGANNFAHTLPVGIGQFYCWDKVCQNGMNVRIAECEYLWHQNGTKPRVFRHLWSGAYRASEADCRSMHPTQKPIALMRWCLSFAPDATTILDPFAGSGTTGVAAKLEGRKATLIEMEERYCEIAANRLSQGVLF